ncbi:hypothetical protein DFJ73DRAFT_852794 [Zopfochytrium polystomum]|nr:hypothetical protein DFJ73DRAFT_852794 [Zopfochytrium polystomum]
MEMSAAGSSRRRRGVAIFAAFAVAIATATSVVAFDGTAPLFVIQGSGHGSDVPENRALPVYVPEAKVDSILGDLLQCTDVTLVVDQPKAHVQDIQRHAHVMQNFKELFDSYPSSVKIPYVAGAGTTDKVLDSLSRCGEFTAATITSDTSVERDLNAKSPVVYSASLRPFDGSDDVASENDAIVRKWVDKIASATPNFQVIFTSSAAKVHHSRRGTISPASKLGWNTTVPFAKQTFLKKYILFSSGIFEGIVALALVLGVVLFSVNALGSLQGPTRFEK